MNICGFEKFSLVDYDNYVTCTVFTKGCNFVCPFCHNSSLVLKDKFAENIPEEDVFSYLQKRKGMVDAVCVSGGEPTLQPDLKDFIKKVKSMGFRVKLDSNGTKPELLKELIDEKLVDYVAMDIKNSLGKYAQTVGLNTINLNPITKSIELLKNSGIDYEFRTTLIKEYHTQNDIEQIAELIKGAKNYALQKFVDNGECITHNLTEVDKETVDSYVEIVKPFVQNVKVRGY